MFNQFARTLDELQSTAADWHGGQWSGLYAFASTGHICEDALAEAEQFLDYAVEAAEQERLRRLIAYFKANLVTLPATE